MLAQPPVEVKVRRVYIKAVSSFQFPVSSFQLRVVSDPKIAGGKTGSDQGSRVTDNWQLVTRNSQLVTDLEMPANLSPEYKAAEAVFRKAHDPQERLAGLREMLRTIPKHKGTDHLQADIKTRIKELSDELEAPRKGPARTAPAHVVRPEGAAQLVLIGPPNAG